MDDKKKIRTYTPDVLVRYRDDLAESTDLPPLLGEIKPDFAEKSQSPRRRKPPRKENEAENALKWAAAERYAARMGWQFKVIRESEIRTPYLANARFLLRHLERSQASGHEQPLLAWISAHGSGALGDWASIMGSGPEIRATVLPACYRLIALRQVDVDLNIPLTLKSVVKALPSA